MSLSTGKESMINNAECIFERSTPCHVMANVIILPANESNYSTFAEKFVEAVIASSKLVVLKNNQTAVKSILPEMKDVSFETIRDETTQVKSFSPVIAKVSLNKIEYEDDLNNRPHHTDSKRKKSVFMLFRRVAKFFTCCPAPFQRKNSVGPS
ncbi:uncharacterized protein LOC143446852 [Clavelina lepadiformis]|uniref:uncharacterized protein LOC143446852 n=1 Tax=Clavelina lepadiformis TaxID=159417 RepID=UPI004041A0F2